jgi:tetrahydromethanopterin S-methyltransferase subunit G
MSTKEYRAARKAAEIDADELQKVQMRQDDVEGRMLAVERRLDELENVVGFSARGNHAGDHLLRMRRDQRPHA